jgi:integrase-like protein
MLGSERTPMSSNTGNVRSNPFAADFKRWRGAQGIAYGREGDGVTFHTLRHTAASLLAELGESEAIRKEVMGHRDIATTQRYTYLRPVHEIPAHERLAAAVPIADLVTDPRRARAISLSGKVSGLSPTQIGKLQQRQGHFDKL